MEKIIYATSKNTVFLHLDTYDELVKGIEDPYEKSKGYQSTIALKYILGCLRELKEGKSLVVQSTSPERMKSFRESGLARELEKYDPEYRTTREVNQSTSAPTT